MWGVHWAGKVCQIFCDNDAVCDVVTHMKPKDPQMQRYLREFLYWVCKYNFHPIVSKIGTRENDVADFLSRNFCPDDAKVFFERQQIPPQKQIAIADDYFDLVADW